MFIHPLHLDKVVSLLVVYGGYSLLVSKVGMMPEAKICAIIGVNTINRLTYSMYLLGVAHATRRVL